VVFHLVVVVFKFVSHKGELSMRVEYVVAMSFHFVTNKSEVVIIYFLQTEKEYTT
jgi:hypothetical protein